MSKLKRKTIFKDTNNFMGNVTTGINAEENESMEEGVFSLDREWRFTYVNKIAADIEGKKAEDLTGKIIWDEYPSLAGTQLESAYRTAMEKRVIQRFETKGVDTGAWYNVFAIPTEKGISIYWQDISAQKRQEKALRETEDLFKALCETSPVGVGVSSTEGVIIYTNPAYERILGYDHGEIVGMKSTDFYWNPEERKSWLGVLKEKGTVRDFEVRFKKKDGKPVWISINTALVSFGGRSAVMGTIQDITERKKMEKELRESEERFRVAQELSPDGFTILRPVRDANGKIIDFTWVYENEAVARQNGTDSKTVVGKRLLELFPGYKRTPFLENYLHVAQTGESSVFEAEYGLESMARPTWYRIVVVRMGEDIAILGQDITERKSTEEALRERESRLRAVLNSLPAAVLITDPTGQMIDANRALREVWGESAPLTAPELYVDYRGWWPETGKRLKAHEWPLAKSVQGKTVRNAIIEIESFDGKRKYIRADSSPIIGPHGENYGAVAINEDITEQKLAGDALRESEERYRAVVQNTRAVILRVDPWGMVRFANRRALELFGYEEDELIGRHVIGTIVPEQEKSGRDLAAMVTELAVDPERFNIHANENMCKSGERIWMEWNNTVIYDSEGQMKESICVGIDATDRKRAEEALRESEKKAIALVAELEQADRNKNQFISVLSHELRNPLAAIYAGIQILDITRDIGETEKAKEIVKRQMNQLCKLVDDLLDMTRISQNKFELKKENIDLNDIIKSAAEDLGPEFAIKGVKLETEIQQRPVITSADPVRVTQAIGNLLSNALKFTHSNGTVRLTLKKDKDNAVISVKDNGIGVSPEILHNIFAPFAQADSTMERNGGGLGLGLSIAKDIVDLHEGSVGVSSDGLGKGSEFTIRLPIIIMGEKPIMEKAVKSKAAKNALNLLIIDDNRDFTDLLSTMLCAAGYNVNIAYDGIEGLKLAKQKKPDVIFCDIGLPGMNGYDVAENIRSDNELKGIKLIALTGYAVEGDVERALKAGFDKHMAKPVDFTSMKNVLEQ